jgi:hypothetical protein
VCCHSIEPWVCPYAKKWFCCWEITEKQEEKKEELYDQIETELRGVQQALHSSRAVSTTLGELELGDESAQLHLLADKVEARLR